MALKRRSKTNSTFFMDIEENSKEKEKRPGSIYRFVKKKEV